MDRQHLVEQILVTTQKNHSFKEKQKTPNKIFLNVSPDRQHLVEQILVTTQKNHSKKNKRPQ
jgi:hypothetical protein